MAHATSKVLLFGPEDNWDGLRAKTAQQALEYEFNDLLGVVDALRECGFVLRPCLSRIEDKKKKILEMMEYAQRQGTSLILTDTVKEQG